jgi:hypothetical protein
MTTIIGAVIAQESDQTDTFYEGTKMIVMNRVVLVLGALLLSTLPAVAVEAVPVGMVSSLRVGQDGAIDGSRSGDSARTGQEDAQLALRQADFERFAQRKIQEFDRNHRFSRSRMKINKQRDGLFRAEFHQIDGGSLAYKVSRSQSRNIPYVAVLSYHEQIFEGFGATPEECSRGKFSPVAVIPNRHIFSYSNGSWN